jgi:uncharacterized membrane protein
MINQIIIHKHIIVVITNIQYNLNDIKPGHWIAGNRGLAWRIYNKQINTVKID